MTCLFTTSLHLRRKTVMSNAAKVTVVIPNYNGLKFMEPCFKALEMQICRDLRSWWWIMALGTEVWNG